MHRIILDFPDDFYDRISEQLPVKKSEYVKGFIFDILNKQLNIIEGKQKATQKKQDGEK